MLDLSSFLEEGSQYYQLNSQIEGGYLPDDSGIKIIDSIRYKGEIYKINKEYELNIDISYSYESNCDRCLKPTIGSVKTKLSGKLISNTGVSEEDDKLDDIILYEENFLDLDEHIWSQVVSSLPMKILCKKECKGLCTNCGIDFNYQTCDCKTKMIDPRLEKLKEFFPKK